jgi:hypothetical protein
MNAALLTLVIAVKRAEKSAKPLITNRFAQNVKHSGGAQVWQHKLLRSE